VAEPAQIGLEPGDHRQRREQQPADWILGVVDATADAEFHAAAGQLLEDRMTDQRRAGVPAVATTWFRHPSRRNGLRCQPAV
jgi:hypothetical protein